MRDFTEMWTRALPNVTAFVRAAVRNIHDADDVVQQVAMAAVEDFDQYDRDCSFVAWVVGIARFRILKYLQLQNRDRHVFGDATLQLLAQAQVNIAPEVDSRLEAAERCLSKLHKRGLKVLEMRYLQSMKPAEIADQMCTTANAVSALLSRIRRAMSECVRRELSTMEDSR